MEYRTLSMIQSKVENISCFANQQVISRYQMDYIKKKQLGLIKEEEELESRIIEIYDKAPGQEPTKLKTEDLITITSSKKKEP